MEKRDKYEKILITVIVIMLFIVAIVVALLISGKLSFNINPKNNIDNNSINNSNNNTNDESNVIDPHDKYSNIKWSTNTKFDEGWVKVWIDGNSDLNIQEYDWNVEKGIFDEPKGIAVKQLPNGEKVKYFECVTSPQVAEVEYIIVLSTNNNLYYVGISASDKMYKLNNDNGKVIELARNIDTKPQLQYTKNDIYALLSSGKLVKVYEDFDSDVNEITAALGLTYEENNSYKTTVVFGPYDTGFYITNENYMRIDDKNRTYILDESNSKFIVNYYFQVSDYGDTFFVSKANKLYKLNSDNKLELVSSKIVSTVNLNKTVANIEYTDNTTTAIELIPETAYQDKISVDTNEDYDFSNQADREAYAKKYLFMQF